MLPKTDVKFSFYFRLFLFVITGFFSFSGVSRAQLLEDINKSLHEKPKFFITLTSFNTFIDGQYANIGGLRMGLNYDQKIKFGIGYFALTNNAVVTELHITENNLDYVTNGNLNLNFFSFSTEYYFFNEFPWQCTVTPVNFGIGSAKYEYVHRPEQKKGYGLSETIILYQPEISVQYSIFKWFGVGISSGYRFTLLRSKKQTQDLNAPTFAIDVRLFIDELYKSFFTDNNK